MPGAPAIPALAPDAAVCLQCGYALRGLDTTRNCPECGSPIRRSLMGNLLEFSAPEYVRSLHRGVIMILVAMILRVLVGLMTIVVMFAVIAAMQSSRANFSALHEQFQLWVAIAALPVTGLMLIGWWLFSMPDPAIVGAEKGQTPRMIIRVTVAVSAAMAVLQLFEGATVTLSGNMLAFAAALLSGVAGTVQFFASVLYVRWLAPRLPDKALHEQTKTYLWLLPVIYVLGMICLGLGPLIAGVMYLLMLNTVRVRLQAILKRIAFVDEVNGANS